MSALSLSYSSLVGDSGHLRSTTKSDEVVTYYFSIGSTSGGMSDGYYVGTDLVHTYSHTEEQYSFIRQKLDEIDGLIDVDFVEVSSASEADLTFYRVWSNTYFDRASFADSNIVGYTYYNADSADITWLDKYEFDSFTLHQKHVIAHEILHGLGLSHPDNDARNPAWDTEDSLMSVNGNSAASLSNLDIIALHSIWGIEDDNGVKDVINDYIAGNPDLIAPIGANSTEALSHYTNFGMSEGRAFDSFDEFGYLASNRDLIALFGSDAEAATNHFIENGFYEGRSDDLFNAQAYGSANPDIFQVFGGDTNLMTRHYIEFGMAEGRSISPFV